MASLIEPEPRLAPRRVNARLDFIRADGRTRLGRQYTPHPFHITRPFHIAGDPGGMATLYLQSSAGGLYGDDDLRLDVRAGPGSSAHLTTQASTVVHPARGGVTGQRVCLSIESDAYLEYCPDPAILFAESRLDAELDVELGAGAVAVVTDAFLPHDPEGKSTPFDHLEALIRVRRSDGEEILLERSDVAGSDWLERTCGLPCYSNFLVAGATDAEAVAQALRDTLDALDSPDIYAGVSVPGDRGVVVFRALAREGKLLTRALETVWRAARIALTQQSVPAPRRK